MMLSQIEIRVKKLDHAGDLPLPQYMTDGAAGMDLLAAVAEEVLLPAGEYALIPTGIAIALPVGFEAQIRPRSGLACLGYRSVCTGYDDLAYRV